MQIEPGYYKFRVVGTNTNGETEVFESWSKHAKDQEELIGLRKEYLEYLTDYNVGNLRVTHTILDKDYLKDQESWYLD